VLKSIGMKRMVLAEKESKSRDLLVRRKRATKGSVITPLVSIALALRSDGDDIRRGRFYRVIADRKAETVRYIRIVDRSGEDYLYPVKNFRICRVPRSQMGRFLAARL
jgi:hypothetical protein